MNFVNLRQGPILFNSWFELDSKHFVIDADQNYLFFFFPFLIYLLPLRCYEVTDVSKWEARWPHEKNIKIIFSLIISMVGLLFVNCITDSKNITGKIAVGYTIIVIFILRFVTKPKFKGKIIKKYKIRIYPREWRENVKLVLAYVDVSFFFIGCLWTLSQNPFSYLWFVGSLIFGTGVSICNVAFLQGKVKIKFVRHK